MHKLAVRRAVERERGRCTHRHTRHREREREREREGGGGVYFVLPNCVEKLAHYELGPNLYGVK